MSEIAIEQVRVANPLQLHSSDLEKASAKSESSVVVVKEKTVIDDDDDQKLGFQGDFILDFPKYARLCGIVSSIVAQSFFMGEFDSIPNCCGENGHSGISTLCVLFIAFAA